MINLVDMIQFQMKNAIKEQKALYEKFVMPSIMDGEVDTLGTHYAEYTESLHHFDVSAFRKTVDYIRNDDADVIASFEEQFQHIPNYVIERNAFDDKRKEILEMDGTPADKQAIFDTLDRRRTKEHNGVIRLFNNMNAYAMKNGIAAPYPNNGEEYDPKDPADREAVASVLGKQETLLERVNHLMLDDVKEKDIETPTEKLQNMTLGELYQYAKERQTNMLQNGLDNLSNLSPRVGPAI